MSTRIKNRLLETGIWLACATGIVLSAHCASHRGLARSTAEGALAGCADWAQSHGDLELLALCEGGRPLTEVLDLFAARRLAGQDAGVDR